MKLSSIDNSKSASKMAALLSQSNYQVRVLHRGDEVEGFVLAVTEGDIVVDLGGKAEGILSKKEFPEIKVGDKVKAYVITESQSGQIILSSTREVENNTRISPNQLKRYQKVLTALRSKNKISAKIVDLNKGGLVLEMDGLRGFLPASQIGSSALSLLEGDLMDKSLSVTVLEVDPNDSKLILAAPGVLNEEVQETWAKFKEGEKVNAKVVAIFPFGVVIEADNIRSLVFSQEVSWEKAENFNSLFTVGQEVEAIVLGIDEKLGKLNLSLKRMAEDPFVALTQDFQVDDVVSGVVDEVVPGGVTVTLKDNVVGFIPAEKMEGSGEYQVGQSTNFLVDSVDKAKRRIILAPFLTSTKGLIYK